MKPLKFIKWLLKSLTLALVLLFVFNFIGAKFNLNVPINIYTITIVTLLRLPGLAMVLIFLLL